MPNNHKEMQNDYRDAQRLPTRWRLKRIRKRCKITQTTANDFKATQNDHKVMQNEYRETRNESNETLNHYQQRRDPE